MGERQCGECFACCSYLKISDPDLEKAPVTHCPHLDLPGPDDGDTLYLAGTKCGSCTIYQNRPQVCKGYRCYWLMGLGHEDDRPDRSGILVDNTRGIPGTAIAKPLWEGATEGAEAKKMIQRFSRGLGRPILVMGWLEKSIARVVGRGAE